MGLYKIARVLCHNGIWLWLQQTQTKRRRNQNGTEILEILRRINVAVFSAMRGYIFCIWLSDASANKRWRYTCTSFCQDLSGWRSRSSAYTGDNQFLGEGLILNNICQTTFDVRSPRNVTSDMSTWETNSVLTRNYFWITLWKTIVYVFTVCTS